MVRHFASADHSVRDFSIQIAETVDKNHNIIERELFWIKLLNTAYPYGLNDSIHENGNISEGLNLLERLASHTIRLYLHIERGRMFIKDDKTVLYSQTPSL